MNDKSKELLAILKITLLCLLLCLLAWLVK